MNVFQSLRAMQIHVSITCPCTCIGSARCLTSLDVTESCSFFSPFPLEQNLLSSENLLETATAACWLLRGSHTSSLPCLVLREDCLPLSRLSCRSVKQSEKPSGSTVLTWDGCSVQVKTRLFLILMAVCEPTAQKFPHGLHFGGILCHRTGCFGEKPSKPICLPATWDQRCPHRVQAVEVSTEANTTAPKSLSSEADLQHWSTWLSPPLTFSGGRRRLVW